MDIQQLRYFVAVCENMNYTKAAQKLYVSRQAVAQSVSRMEEELSGKLFLLDNGRLSITPLGEKVYAGALEMLSSFDSFEKSIHGYVERQNGSLKVLTGAAVLTNFPVDILARFNAMYANIMLSVTEADNAEMRTLLDIHKADVALMGTSPAFLSGYRYTCLKKQELTILVNRDDPLSKKDYLTMEDLKGKPMIGHGESYDLHRFYVSSCREAGFEPTFSMISTNVDLILYLLKENRTVCFGASDQDDDNSRFIGDFAVSVPLRIRNKNLEWGIYAVTAGDRPGKEVQKLFINFLMDTADKK